jgi:prepilin peptidase CpaA
MHREAGNNNHGNTMLDLSLLVREGALVALLVTAMAIDIRTFRIPNWLTFGGAALGLLLSLWPAGHPDILGALGGLALGLATLLPLRMAGVLGAGDVKLMAMAGAFIGAPQVLYAVLFSLVAGGLVAFGYAIWQRATGRMLANVRETVLSTAFALAAGQRPQFAAMPSIGKVPYGIGICAGTLSWLAARHLVQFV